MSIPVGAGLESAQHHLEAARTQHAAAAILATLAVGDPCPVCGEPITSLAPHTAPDLAAAETALEAEPVAGFPARSASDFYRLTLRLMAI